MAPRRLLGVPRWLPEVPRSSQMAPSWFPEAAEAFQVQNLSKMTQRALQKPSHGVTMAKRNDFETCYFVLFFVANLEHLASQDGPKTAKKRPKVLLESHMEPFQKSDPSASQPPARISTSRSSRALPGASRTSLRLPAAQGGSIYKRLRDPGAFGKPGPCTY